MEVRQLPQNKQIALLHKIVLNIMKHLELAEVVDEIINQAAQLVAAPTGFSCLVEQDKLNMHWIGTEGIEPVVNDYSLHRGDGAIEEVLQSGKTLIIDDYSVYPKGLPHISLDDLKTIVIVPIRSSQAVIGVIGVVYLHKIQSVSTEQVEILTYFADLTSVAIDHGRLYAHVQAELKQRTQREIELLESEEKYRLVFQNVNDAICFIDINTLRFIEVNQQFLDLFGYNQAEIDQQTVLDLTAEPAEMLKMLENAKAGKQLHTDEQWQKRKNGMVFFVELRGTSFLWRGKLVLCAVLRDITDRKFNEDKIAYLAYHDMLTDLPNRRLVEDRLKTAIAQAKRSQTLLAVLFLDFDGMKPINDALGHETGDEFLKNMAEKLVQYTRDGDTVARLGGDEFVIVLPDLIARQAAEEIAARLIDQCQGSFELSDQDIKVSVSIGISFFPDHGRDGKSLIKYADRAMYQAKRLGGKRFCIYEK
jgi:diguanylate cyclase (GGDEF)-like protein/PAS domain S-box-containing protein